MKLNFDAVGFQGPLVDFIDWAKMLPTTLLYLNHICIVDFSKEKLVKATFFSKDSYCSGEVNF